MINQSDPLDDAYYIYLVIKCHKASDGTDVHNNMLCIWPIEDYLRQAHGCLLVSHISKGVWDVHMQYQQYKTAGVAFTSKFCAEHAVLPAVLDTGKQKIQITTKKVLRRELKQYLHQDMSRDKKSMWRLFRSQQNVKPPSKPNFVDTEVLRFVPRLFDSNIWDEFR